MSASSARTKTVSSVSDAITLSARKLSVELKEKQREALLKFCLGRDVFVSLPTGYGKSMIFGLLPMVFNILNGVTNSIVICISPLTAIMQEQTRRFCKAGITSGFVGESQKDPAVRWKVLNGLLDLVYISPENIICNPQYRDMLLTPDYKERLVGVAVDEAHCVKTWGQDFREAFYAIGEIRSIIPDHVSIMALTATATCNTFDVIVKQLSLKDPVVVAISPNRANIKLSVKPSQSLEEFAAEISEGLKLQKINYPKTILFCNSYNDCSRIYERMLNYLGNDKTVFRGYPNLLEYRLFTMYTRASEDEMKEKIMLLFNTKDTNLRIIIATAAFSMGVDIADVRQIIHWGSPSCVEEYVQEIGRAGRDGADAFAILVNKKTWHSSKPMKDYTKNTDQCRRSFLFGNFVNYKHCVNYVKCKCCDICTSYCDCEICKK